MTANRAFKLLDRLLLPLAWLIWALRRVLRPCCPVLARPRRILAVKLCCLGDSLLSLYALRALGRKFSGLHLTLLAGGRTRAVFEGHSFIQEVVELPLFGQAPWREILRLRRVLATLLELRRGRFDTFLDLDLYYQFTTFIPLLLGIPQSVGFVASAGRAPFYTRRVPRHRTRHERLCFFDLLGEWGVEPDDRPVALPSDQAADQYAQQHLGSSPGVFTLGVFPGSSPNWPQKRWPLEHYAALLNQWVGRFPFTRVALFGAAFEIPLHRALCRQLSFAPVNLAGKTTLRQLAACLRRCHIFLGNDSGPAQLADMLGVKTLVIFGPTDPRKWGPHRPGNRALHLQLECQPCYYLSYMPRCGRSYACLVGLTMDRVRQELYDAALECCPRLFPEAPNLNPRVSGVS